MVDENRQWFKAREGLEARETPRDVAFCHYTIQLNETLVVEDASADPRFAQNPLVTGAPNIRFYAGHPIVVDGVHRIGTLCVIDTVPRQLDPHEAALLQDFAMMAGELIEARRDRRDLSIFGRLSAALSSLHHADDLEASEGARALFDELLDTILLLTGSKYGFIGEIHSDDRSPRYLKTHAITDISWDEETRAFYNENAAKGFEFRNLDTLFGHTIRTGEQVISNDPATDPRAGGRPKGHPPLNAYLGVPLISGGNFIGMVGVANRPGGYDERIVERNTRLFEAIANVVRTRRAERQRAETANQLLESQRRYELAVQGADAGVWDWDIAGDQVYWSDRMLGLIGLRDEDLSQIGESLNERLHPDDGEAVRSALLNHLKEQVPFQVECRVLHKNGHYVTLNLRGQARWDEHGRAIRMAGSAIDVTGRIRLRDDLHRARDDLQVIFDSVPARIWYKDDRNRILRANAKAAESMGLPLEEIEGANTYDLFPEMAAEYHRDDLEVINSGLPKLGIVEEYTPKDRACGWVRTDKVPHTDPRTGERYLLVAATDVTAEIEAQRQLAHSEERFALAAEAASVGIWDWHIPTGRHLRTKIFSDLIGLTPGDLSETHDAFEKLIHPDDLKSFVRAMRAHLERKRPFEIEMRVRHPTDKYRWFLSTGQAVWDDSGQAVRMVGTIMDIHERKLAETMKSEFVSTVSHELRTPMTSVLGSLKLIKSGSFGELSAKGESLINIATTNGERLLRLINDILDIEKIEAGQMAFDEYVQDLRPLLRSALMGISGAAPTADAAEVNLLMPEEPVFAKVDQDRFIQVLTNLLSNAMKFGGDNPQIKLAVEVSGEDAIVSVTDNGPGIPPDQLEAIFNRFQQVDSGDNRQQCGTGLGLPISRSLVEAMDGELAVASALGEGATFSIRLPMQQPANAEETVHA